MNANFPIALQFDANGSEKRLSARRKLRIRVSHGSNKGVSGRRSRIFMRRRAFNKRNTKLFETQLQKSSDQKHVELNGETSVRSAQKAETSQRTLKKTKHQFDLPAVSVQQNDLKRGQSETVSQNEVRFLTNMEGDKAVNRFSVGIREGDELVSDRCK